MSNANPLTTAAIQFFAKSDANYSYAKNVIATFPAIEASEKLQAHYKAMTLGKKHNPVADAAMKMVDWRAVASFLA